MTLRSKLTLFTCFALITITLATCSVRKALIAEDDNGKRLEHSKGFQHRFVTHEDFSLHYVEWIPATDREPRADKPQSRPNLVLLHGTPGNWKALNAMMLNDKLLGTFNFYAVDRPGWGDSIISGKMSEPDFHAQSKMIMPLLAKIRSESDAPILVVGHSYGGSMAAYIAAQRPEFIDGLLIAAGAIDPSLALPRWYNRLASNFLVSKILPKSLVISNTEIYGVAPALNEITNWWPNAHIPMIFVQGEKDKLVHPNNLNFAETEFNPTQSKVVRIPDEGHFIHMKQADLLADLSLELLEFINRDSSLSR